MWLAVILLILLNLSILYVSVLFAFALDRYYAQIELSLIVLSVGVGFALYAQPAQKYALAAKIKKIGLVVAAAGVVLFSVLYPTVRLP